MKKMISFILAVALSAAVAMPAFAAAPETTKADNANTWTTSGSDAVYAGTMMTMVAYAPTSEGSITVDSIQYIDQTTADESGAYAFENYIPKVVPVGETSYTVKVGGENITAALDAGVVTGGTLETVPVTGSASVLGTKVATIAVKSGDEVIDSAEITGNGTYSLNIAPGTYDLVYSAEGYLSYTITGVPVEADLPALPAVTLIAGDVDGTGTVTADDIGAVASAFNSSDLYKSAYDFDNTGGVITADDVGAASMRFKETATTIAYADLVQ